MTLTKLSSAGSVRFPDGAYDVRGWQVRMQADGDEVGRVDDMLVDEHGRPRYLDVDLGPMKKHVLLPLAEAHADPSEQVVWIDRLGPDALRDLPEYDPRSDALTDEYEDRLLREYSELAAGRPTARERREGEERPRLVRLGELDEYRVAKGVTDPRGWKVIAGDGETIGEVRELIVDTAAMTTRYLDADVDERRLGIEPLDRHVLLPTERVRLDRSKKHVLVDGLFARDVEDYPVYGGLPLERSDEQAIEAAFARTRTSEREGRGAEAAAHRFFGVRTRAAGTPPSVRSRGRPGEPEPSMEEPEPWRAGQSETVVHESNEVRIRISGDDIIIEKHPRGSRDDG